MRNFGLDMARAIAIISVLICHAHPFIAYYLDSTIPVILGLLGVEIFFTLSGFLIGKIIVEEVVGDNTWTSLKRFYIRRWFRTLPLYYIVLIFLMIIYSQLQWKHLFFIQNYDKEALLFFPVAWSLSVEEWFYFLTPPIILLYTRKSKNKGRAFVSICLLIIILSLLARVAVYFWYNLEWVYGLRMNTFLRLDSIMFGVLLAGGKVYYSKIYNWFSRWISLIFFLSVAGLYYCGYYFTQNYFSGKFESLFFANTFYFSLISFFAVLLIFSFEKYMDHNIPMYCKRFIEVISKTSYCVYLIHFDIYLFFMQFNNQNYIGKSIFLLVFSTTVIYTLAIIIYRYFESPLLAYRNKITELNKGPVKESQ